MPRRDRAAGLSSPVEPGMPRGPQRGDGAAPTHTPRPHNSSTHLAALPQTNPTRSRLSCTTSFRPATDSAFSAPKSSRAASTQQLKAPSRPQSPRGAALAILPAPPPALAPMTYFSRRRIMSQQRQGSRSLLASGCPGLLVSAGEKPRSGQPKKASAKPQSGPEARRGPRRLWLRPTDPQLIG